MIISQYDNNIKNYLLNISINKKGMILKKLINK